MRYTSFLAVALVSALFAVPSVPSRAQSFPNRLITMVSPFPAGSGSDLTARAMGPALGEVLGQAVVVQNKPGAGGSIGADFVAKSRPDGYTLFLASLSFSVLPSVMDLPFDPVKDFDAVTMAGQQNMAFVVSASFPANSMAELVAMAKAQPGKLNYASAGVGSIGHLTGELLKSERGLNLVHVPFKGTPEALTAIISGEVQVSLVAMPAVEPQIKANKVKALAVTGEKRHATLPDIPTMAEAGFPSMGDSVWYAILVPAGTPRQIIDQLNGVFHKVLTQPATVDRLANSAKTLASTSTPEQASAYVRAQVAKWTAIAKQAGIKRESAK